MSANFEIKIQSIRTATVNNLTNVIRKVEFIVIGSENGCTFQLFNNVDLAEPDATFIEFNNLTEAQVIKFVEDNFENMDAVKAHIQYVLDREVAKAALELTLMPWAPVIEETPAQ